MSERLCHLPTPCGFCHVALIIQPSIIWFRNKHCTRLDNKKLAKTNVKVSRTMRLAEKIDWGAPETLSFAFPCESYRFNLSWKFVLLKLVVWTVSISSVARVDFVTFPAKLFPSWLFVRILVLILSFVIQGDISLDNSLNLRNLL